MPCYANVDLKCQITDLDFAVLGLFKLFTNLNIGEG